MTLFSSPADIRSATGTSMSESQRHCAGEAIHTLLRCIMTSFATRRAMWVTGWLIQIITSAKWLRMKPAGRCHCTECATPLLAEDSENGNYETNHAPMKRLRLASILTKTQRFHLLRPAH